MKRSLDSGLQRDRELRKREPPYSFPCYLHSKPRGFLGKGPYPNTGTLPNSPPLMPLNECSSTLCSGGHQSIAKNAKGGHSSDFIELNAFNLKNCPLFLDYSLYPFGVENSISFMVLCCEEIRVIFSVLILAK